MRWPSWLGGRETRASGGDFSDAVVRLIEAQAAGSAADASSTAAVEAASGALSRAFASAEVVGEPWVAEAISPGFLAQVGRDLIRAGGSMHVIRMGRDGMVKLIPASSWHWEGSHDPATWTVRVTAYGPSTSTTWNLPASGVVFVRWGGTPGQPYVGTGPLSWAHTTARLQSETERSLFDEMSGPLAQIISPGRAARHCLWRPSRPVGARARRARRNKTGSNTGLGRNRPKRSSRFARIPLRPCWPLVEYRQACSLIAMAQASAKLSGAGILARSNRLPGLSSMN